MVRQLNVLALHGPILARFATLSRHPALKRWNDRSLRIAVLLVLMALLNLVDLRYTLFAHQVGMLGEMNPIAANFLSQGLEPSLISYKILCVIVSSAVLWRVRKSPWVSGACWALVMLYVGLGITWLMWAQTFDEIKLTEMAMLFSH